MFSPNQFYEFALQKSMQWHTFYNRLRLITQMGYKYWKFKNKKFFAKYNGKINGKSALE